MSERLSIAVPHPTFFLPGTSPVGSPQTSFPSHLCHGLTRMSCCRALHHLGFDLQHCRYFSNYRNPKLEKVLSYALPLCPFPLVSFAFIPSSSPNTSVSSL